MGASSSSNTVRRFACKQHIDFIVFIQLRSARKTDPEPFPKPRDLLSSNPYTPTSTLAQSIMNASPLLTELIVVREWLHETAPLPQHPEATTGYWKFTKHSVMQALRMGSGRDGLVREMDPDAVNREEGRTLAADDAVSPTSRITTLFF